MNDNPVEKLLHEGLEALQLTFVNAEAILAYLALLEKWNKAYNLTAIRAPLEMITHHVLDSLSVYRFLHGKTITDVGTGGGLPGVILAIAAPHWSVTLLDSSQKKTRFLRQVKRELGLANVSVECQRVEKYSPPEHSDVIISRAFSETTEFLRLCRHLGDKDSLFYAMKGPRQERMPGPDEGFELIRSETIQVPSLAAQRKLHVFRKS